MFLLKNSWATRRQAFSLLAGGVLLLGAATADAQITKSGSGYLMRVKYVKGQVLKYNSVNSMANPGQGGAMSVTMPIKMQVVDVKNGKATTKATIGPITMGGSQIKPAETVTMTLDTRNQASNAQTSQMMGAQFPAAAVKVGQTWSTSAPIPSMGGQSTKMKAVYKFQGIKTVKGKSVAVITYTMSGGATGSGTLTFLTSDGTLFSNEAKLSMSAGGSGKVSVTSKMTRA